jgi:nucleotide-binding universal stress UspA family protein
MHTILVPVDGSKNALRAVDVAIGNAKRVRGRVHLLNVQPVAEHYGMVLAYLDRKEHRDLGKERAAAIVAPSVKRLKKARVAHEVHIAFGEVAAEIVRSARRFGCDSIVMGTRGLGAVGSLLLGSVASKVIHRANVPVTLVK